MNSCATFTLFSTPCEHPLKAVPASSTEEETFPRQRRQHRSWPSLKRSAQRIVGARLLPPNRHPCRPSVVPAHGEQGDVEGNLRNDGFVWQESAVMRGADFVCDNLNDASDLSTFQRGRHGIIRVFLPYNTSPPITPTPNPTTCPVSVTEATLTSLVSAERTSPGAIASSASSMPAPP